MTTYCIIDDEPIAHRIIEGYCENLPYLEKKGNCYDAFEAMQLLNKISVDLIFLDINMPKISGFDLLKTMMNPPRVIVTSAHQEFALEGYELNISDYLLKPFSLERFMKAINKAINSKKSIEPIPLKELAKFSFFLKGDKKMHQVHADEILYIEAFRNYSKVYFENEMIVSHEKISSFEELLPVENFLRIHKSFIIATDKIKLIEGNRISIGEHRVPIGQTYKNALKKLFRKD